MEVLNLKERYSANRIREWKKQGLILITERPPTTTEELFIQFFTTRKTNKKPKIKLNRTNKTKLDWRDYTKGE